MYNKHFLPPLRARRQLPVLLFPLLPPRSWSSGGHRLWRRERPRRSPGAQKLPGATARAMCAMSSRCGSIWSSFRPTTWQRISRYMPYTGIITSSLTKSKRPTYPEWRKLWASMARPLWTTPQEVSLISSDLMKRRKEARRLRGKPLAECESEKSKTVHLLSSLPSY